MFGVGTTNVDFSLCPTTTLVRCLMMRSSMTRPDWTRPIRRTFGPVCWRDGPHHGSHLARTCGLLARGHVRVHVVSTPLQGLDASEIGKFPKGTVPHYPASRSATRVSASRWKALEALRAWYWAGDGEGGRGDAQGRHVDRLKDHVVDGARPPVIRDVEGLVRARNAGRGSQRGYRPSWLCSRKPAGRAPSVRGENRAPRAAR